MVKHEQQPQSLSIQLLPNRSISWRGMCWFVGTLGALCFSIALFWALQGAWMILPFAGLEIALLAYLSLRVCSNSYNKQVIHINEAQIQIEWGYMYPKKHWQFQREQAQFVIHRAKHSLSPDHVELCDKTQPPLRLGEALNREDIQQFTQLIRGSGVSYQIKGRTKIEALDEREIFR